MKICVWSKNPAKISACERAFSDFFRKEVEVIPFPAESNVAAQPVNKEIFLGAENRARECAKREKAEFYVGLESGLLAMHRKNFIVTVACVMDKDGNISFGLSPGYPVSEKIAEELKEGRELHEIAEEISGIKDARSEHGFIAFLTSNLVKRSELNYYAVLMALSFLKLREI